MLSAANTSSRNNLSVISWVVFPLAVGVLATCASAMAPSIAGWLRERLSRQLRAPQADDPFHFVAKYLMKKFNPEPGAKIVELLELDQLSTTINKLTVVEVGPGLGFSLDKLFQDHYYDNCIISNVHGIEISESFRQDLATKFKNEIKDGLLQIHANDAKSLPFLPDSSVDAIYALNVIYFLNPLEDYLAEFYRVLKPGGKILFVAGDDVKTMDPTYFVNCNWQECATLMTQVGFHDARVGEGFGLLYTNTKGKLYPIVGTKSSSFSEEQ